MRDILLSNITLLAFRKDKEDLNNTIFKHHDIIFTIEVDVCTFVFVTKPTYTFQINYLIQLLGSYR